jgi:tRNA (mo5U34)-methyltransferase
MSDLAEAIAAVPFWWHSIDLGDGCVTPGHKPLDLLHHELSQLSLVDLADKSVLDIGAWDGWFSFAAERLGARKVVALDHFVWSMDLGIFYSDPRAAAASLPAERFGEIPGLWNPQDLPGKRGFDCAHRALNSRVGEVVADFMTADLEEIGTFDVVFYLGVLYHMRHPLLALERLRRVTGGIAYIETAAISIPGQEDLSLCEFYGASELERDPGNWWAPTASALLAMCRAAGFGDAELLVGPPAPPTTGNTIQRYRAVVRAYS